MLSCIIALVIKMNEKLYLLDLDGTMYRGSKIQTGAKEFIEYLHKTKQSYMFLTNNSKRTRIQNVEHMRQMGFENIHPEDFFTSAMAAASYVRKHYTMRKAWYIGEDGLGEALLDNGFTLVSDEQPDFVFVGLDQQADYKKYSQAIQYLVNGAILIGTNDDRLLAQSDGFALGNGAVVHMLAYATNQSVPKIGKPNAPILEECLHLLHKNTDEVIIIGDNLETDIALGVRQGVETILVEGGVHARSDCDRLGIHADRVIASLFDLIVEN